MTLQYGMASCVGRLAALVLAGAGTVCALAQPETPAACGPLRVEATMGRHLYSPSRPMWLRVVLYNTSDQAVEIPTPTAAEAGGAIALPPEVVFGTAEEPSLFVTFEAEKPVAVPALAGADTAAGPKGVLRLAAHGSVGTEIDLREHLPTMRYCGTYRLEWRPLGGQAGSASVDFRVELRKDAILVTDKVGKVTFSLMYDEAPRNVEAFIELVRSGFYDNKTFHRVIPGGLIQGGCPKGDGTGARLESKLLPAEFRNTPFLPGTLAMARLESDPNSASCQFFITLSRLPALDGQYTVIGQASDEESLRTLNQLAAEPIDANDKPRHALVIRSITLVDAEQPGTMRLDLKPTRSVSSPTTAPATQPAASAQP